MVEKRILRGWCLVSKEDRGVLSGSRYLERGYAGIIAGELIWLYVVYRLTLRYYMQGDREARDSVGHCCLGMSRPFSRA